ncbi:filamentous hemagglutinin N-terminal domain-containing protein [Scytonema hofmannii]|uniref:two-partner secretion domain-containing protein n=1 Tax=Scytonema hofmannii TaxID=34078 RepID=UPI00234F2494|nr:filamentous hemagglutinin N-terminal domain-containing protein [Scytonema hofmannii]
MISSVERTLAQSNIVPDNTLGTETSRVITNSDGLPIENISGGAYRGVNLFHSFREFNVDEGRAVYFTNPAGIENILSRVTGRNRSQILGKLGVLGNANLFLINPNGIIFGPNASLDVNGSFVVTSANAIQFGEQGFFSASFPETPPLLTINPSALFFNQVGAGSIENRSIASAGVNSTGNPVFGLRVPNGQSLLLVGGDIALNSGGLNALGGRVELAGAASPGTIGLSFNDSNLALTFPNQVVRGDVSLTNKAFINVAADGGGAIALHAKNINLSGGSSLNAGILAGLGTPEIKAGDVTLNATQAISLSQSSRIINQVSQDATGNAGNINLQTGSLNLTEGSQLNARTLGRGNSGNVFVDVSGAVTIDGEDSNGFPSGIINQVQRSAIGNGGDINIKAESLTLTRGSLVSASTLGRGNSGNVFVDVSGTVTIDGEDSNGSPSRIMSLVQPFAVGNGGDINIKAESLTLTQGGTVTASTFGKGNSRNILVDVKGAVIIDGKGGNYSVIANQIQESAVGNGGDISIKAESLTLTRRGLLSTATLGRGNSGNISVDVKSAVTIDGAEGEDFVSAVRSEVAPSAIGNSGNINIKAESLTLKQGGFVNTSTLGKGDSGNILVNVSGALTLEGVDSSSVTYPSRIASQVLPSAIGDGGDINIKAGSVTLKQNGTLNTAIFGKGNAGNISMDVKGAVTVDGKNSDSFGGFIATQVTESAVGDGGDINIKAESLSLTQGGSLTASTFGQGNGGNIFVDVKGAITVDGEGSNGFPSGINTEVAPSAIGNGGDINVKAESLSLTQKGTVSASTSGQGNSGNIRVNLTMPTSKLILSDGARIQASTLGQGKGGNIQIEASDSVNLTNDAKISVNSQGQGNAGELGITTGSLTLRGRSRLLADTVSSEGGNIQLQVRDILLLSDKSGISTTAGQQGAGGNGGNIDINTNFLVAVPSENSDITANAFEGRGGLIGISTQGIFGLKKRESLTPLSDITAFSQQNPQFDGEIVINIENPDISNELVALPTNLVDVGRLITQGCSVGRVITDKQESQFIVTGRGGLPPQPGEALRIPAIAVHGSTFVAEKQDQSPDITTTPLVEANGWRFDEHGQVILTAATTSGSASFGTQQRECHGF